MTDLKALTLGRRIQALRREQSLTQEALAEHMGVTPQAVSKWENALSCPDIMSLPRLAQALHTTVDTLLTGQSASDTPTAPVKPPEELIVRISIHPDDEARVCLNLPYTVFSLAARYDMLTFTFSANDGDIDAEKLAREMAKVDFRAIAALIAQGARGMLVNVEDTLTIWTE